MPPHHMAMPHRINSHLNQSHSEKVATAGLRLAGVGGGAIYQFRGPFLSIFFLATSRTDLAQVGEDTRSTVAAAGWESLLIFLQFFG